MLEVIDKIPEEYIGVILGVIVFLCTLTAVFMLLYHGGSFDRMNRESMGLPANPGDEKAELYDELLDKSMKLSKKIESIVLHGKLITLRPLNIKEDSEILFKLSNGMKIDTSFGNETYDANEYIWKYMKHGPFENATEFCKIHLANKDDCSKFVIENNLTKEIIGMLNVESNSPRNLRCAIGSIWYHPMFHGSGLNTESVLLILKHLFDTGYRRVEWRCDAFNIRARKAAHSLGFTFDGVLRKDMIVKKSNRDTVIFSIINSEWPIVEEHLQTKVMKILKSMEDNLKKKEKPNQLKKQQKKKKQNKKKKEKI